MLQENTFNGEISLSSAMHFDPRRLIIIPSVEEQEFYLKTNKLLEKVRSNPLTCSLFEPLLQLLRKHCELLLPMTTGTYRSHGAYSLNGGIKSKEKNWLNIKNRVVGASKHYEPIHLATHIVPHIAEYLIELFNHDFLSLPAAFISFIPLLGALGSGGVKLLELWKEHHLIHELQNQLGKLMAYDATLREVLYKFVTARTLLALAPLLENDETLGNAVSVLIFSQLLSTLFKLEQVFPIENFALQWSQHVINQFILHNVLPPTIRDTENIKVLKEHFDNILTQKESPSSRRFQAIFYWDYKPKTLTNYKEKDIIHPLWHLIYTKFLSSYAHRVSVGEFWSKNFAFYSEDDLKNLREYYIKLDTAVNFIQKTLFELNYSKEYGTLFLYFNLKLLTILDDMANVIPWTDYLKKEIINLQKTTLSISQFPQAFFVKKESKKPEDKRDQNSIINDANVSNIANGI